ncbi:iron-containing alcohol dehydrogenase [Desulfococcaceae bacterium HSG8]|nr:iron-containing alcohol dehydrogenase [Desulfococcaceae bacterium HSG8]
MIMKFEFATATRIIFGSETLKKVAPLASEMGKRAMVVTGQNAERAEPLLNLLKSEGMETVTFRVPGEPETEMITKGTERARKADCDLVISIGGGSVLDTGKAIAALLANKGDLTDYLEIIGKGKPLLRTPAPCIAIPTTSGTGSEVTKNAVIASPGYRVKVSLRSPLMFPRLAVIDPELTHTMPPGITASTGLDALTQVTEAYVSPGANPLTDSLCCEGIRRAARSLRRAYEDGEDAAAREDMAIVSLLGGIALANAKLGAVHGFAGPVGGMFPVPHGVVCGRMLPYVMRANIRALQARAPGSSALTRYDEIARIFTGKKTAASADGVDRIQELCADMGVPELAEFGLKKSDFPEVVSKSKNASSMKGNPVQLTDQELTKILEDAV